MKNKKPLQFVKELPPHAELWKIIDETIIYPAEGLSVEQIKHHMYVYLCSSEDFKYDKLMLQTNIEIEHLQHVKSQITKHRDLSYPELLPTVEGLPSSLLIFIYNHYIHTEVLGIEAYNIFKNILTTLTTPLPYLSTLPHSDEVVEVYEKRQVELVIYRALLENMPIPTFKLVVAPTTTADSDGWIEWNGGGCPVDSGAHVEIRTRNGNINTGYYFRWGHSNLDGDIMAYRIIKEDGNET